MSINITKFKKRTKIYAGISVILFLSFLVILGSNFMYEKRAEENLQLKIINAKYITYQMSEINEFEYKEIHSIILPFADKYQIDFLQKSIAKFYSDNKINYREYELIRSLFLQNKKEVNLLTEKLVLQNKLKNLINI
jgi:c-di-AMP phosphodiesterase-like protein